MKQEATLTTGSVGSLFGIAGKTAVVTGSGSGIGQSIAATFVAQGARVVGIDISSEGLAQTAELCRNGTFFQCRADISSGAEVQATADDIAGRIGGVDFLINSAGVNRKHSAESFPESDWRFILDVNLTGTFLCAQAFGAAMIARGCGRIVNIGSIAGLGGYSEAAAYMSSKGGIVQLTKALAIEWSARGVNVNAIAPGLTRTPMFERVVQERPAVAEWQLSRMAIPKPIEPEDIAAAAIFLCSPAARFITGHSLAVDGGYLAF